MDRGQHNDGSRAPTSGDAASRSSLSLAPCRILSLHACTATGFRNSMLCENPCGSGWKFCVSEFGDFFWTAGKHRSCVHFRAASAAAAVTSTASQAHVSAVTVPFSTPVCTWVGTAYTDAASTLQMQIRQVQQQHAAAARASATVRQNQRPIYVMYVNSSAAAASIHSSCFSPAGNDSISYNGAGSSASLSSCVMPSKRSVAGKEAASSHKCAFAAIRGQRGGTRFAAAAIVVAG